MNSCCFGHLLEFQNQNRSKQETRTQRTFESIRVLKHLRPPPLAIAHVGLSITRSSSTGVWALPRGPRTHAQRGDLERVGAHSLSPREAEIHSAKECSNSWLRRRPPETFKHSLVAWASSLRLSHLFPLDQMIGRCVRSHERRSGLQKPLRGAESRRAQVSTSTVTTTEKHEKPTWHVSAHRSVVPVTAKRRTLFNEGFHALHIHVPQSDSAVFCKVPRPNGPKPHQGARLLSTSLILSNKSRQVPPTLIKETVEENIDSIVFHDAALHTVRTTSGGEWVLRLCACGQHAQSQSHLVIDSPTVTMLRSFRQT